MIQPHDMFSSSSNNNPTSHPLESASPSPTTALSYNYMQASPVQNVCVATSYGSLVTPDQAYDPFLSNRLSAIIGEECHWKSYT